MPFDNHPLSDDQIRAKAPSVFATHAAPTVSDRYAYIPTYPVLRDLRTMGLDCIDVAEGRKVDPDGRSFAMHVLRFRERDADTKFRDRTRPLGDLIPEVILRNSHDRTSPLSFQAGMRRKVCMNGLYVEDISFNARVRHVGRSVHDQVHSKVGEILGRFGEVIGTAEYWHSINMTPELAKRFAQTALEIRGTSISVDPIRVVANVHTHRWEDREPSLWNLFNRAQENLMNGHVSGTTALGRHRRLNRVTSLASEVDLNRKLWAAAAALAEELKPRGGAVVGAAA